LGSANGLTRDEPVEAQPGIVAGDARRVRSAADRDAARHESPDGRAVAGSLAPVPIDEVFTLKGHAMLNRHAALESGDAIEVPHRQRLCMVEKPAHTRER